MTTTWLLQEMLCILSHRKKICDSYVFRKQYSFHNKFDFFVAILRTFNGGKDDGKILHIHMCALRNRLVTQLVDLNQSLKAGCRRIEVGGGMVGYP